MATPTTTLNYVKTALRISSDNTALEAELQLLIDDCLMELEMLGVYHPDEHTATSESEEVIDKQILIAVIAYCKWKYGDNDSAERWEHIYSDKLEKLSAATGYGGEHGQV